MATALGPPQERNQDATCYIKNMEQQVDEEILWELFTQVGLVHNVYIPRDRITGTHSGYGFVEMKSELDANYAISVLNNIQLYGKAIRVSNAGNDKKVVDIGANLFIGNLEPEVTETLLFTTFRVFGNFVSPPRIAKDGKKSKGYAFISYDRFESSDAAIAAMNGQYLSGSQISVRYARKGNSSKDYHGTKAERLLAARNPLLQHQHQQRQTQPMISTQQHHQLPPPPPPSAAAAAQASSTIGTPVLMMPPGYHAGVVPPPPPPIGMVAPLPPPPPSSSSQQVPPLMGIVPPPFVPPPPPPAPPGI